MPDTSYDTICRNIERRLGKTKYLHISARALLALIFIISGLGKVWALDLTAQLKPPV